MSAFLCNLSSGRLAQWTTRGDAATTSAHGVSRSMARTHSKRFSSIATGVTRCVVQKLSPPTVPPVIGSAGSVGRSNRHPFGGGGGSGCNSRDTCSRNYFSVAKANVVRSTRHHRPVRITLPRGETLRNVRIKTDQHRMVGAFTFRFYIFFVLIKFVIRVFMGFVKTSDDEAVNK